MICIRGAPGIGKSTIARRLCKELEKKCYLIEVDSLRGGFIPIDWMDREIHIKSVRLAAVLVNYLLKNGIEVVCIEDTFAGQSLHEFIKCLKISSNVQNYVLTLISSHVDLKKRVNSRSESRFKDLEICLSINRGFKSGHFKVPKFMHEFIIDTTNLSKSEMVSKCMRILKNHGMNEILNKKGAD
ncbi:MAG: AAA family ATPase [Candidatus Helarchaeota archaeon]